MRAFFADAHVSASTNAPRRMSAMTSAAARASGPALAGTAAGDGIPRTEPTGLDRDDSSRSRSSATMTAVGVSSAMLGSFFQPILACLSGPSMRLRVWRGRYVFPSDRPRSGSQVTLGHPSRRFFKVFPRRAPPFASALAYGLRSTGHTPRASSTTPASDPAPVSSAMKVAFKTL